MNKVDKEIASRDICDSAPFTFKNSSNGTEINQLSQGTEANFEAVSKGLSTFAILGIVLAGVLLAALVTFIIYRAATKKYRQAEKLVNEANEMTATFERDVTFGGYVHKVCLMKEELTNALTTLVTDKNMENKDKKEQLSKLWLDALNAKQDFSLADSMENETIRALKQLASNREIIEIKISTAEGILNTIKNITQKEDNNEKWRKLRSMINSINATLESNAGYKDHRVAVKTVCDYFQTENIQQISDNFNSIVATVPYVLRQLGSNSIIEQNLINAQNPTDAQSTPHLNPTQHK